MLSGAEGIAVACSDANKLTDAINAAVDSGVPVATFDSDAPASKRFVTYGVDDISCGVQTMDELAKVMNGRGVVAILAGNQNAPNLQLRVRGVREAAKILDIEKYLDRKPKQLSGGQRQRVAIGRAIVRAPKVFLFDEPLSNLDATLRVRMRFELARLHRELGSASTVYVTHDQVEAMTLADRIVLLQPLAGREDAARVAQIGTPLALYHHPANRFVAGFIGSPAMNFIDARVTALADGRVEAAAGGLPVAADVSPQGLAPGEPVTLGIRPEHVVVGQGPLRARVSHVERLGELSHVYLDVAAASALLLAKTPRDDIAIGDELPFELPAAQMHVFRADGVSQPRDGRRPGRAVDPGLSDQVG